MEINKDIFYTIIGTLSIVIIFSIGYFTANALKFEKPPIVVEKLTDNTYFNRENEKLQPLGVESVVVSRYGNKFHYEWCSGAKSIKPENKVYFKSAEDAINAGYTLASNCK